MTKEVTQHKHLTSVGTLKGEPQEEEPLFLRAGVLDKMWGGEWLLDSSVLVVRFVSLTKRQ